MFHLSESRITKLLTKPTKEKEKEKENEEGNIYQKIVPSKVLVDQKGWKVSLFKGMYVARLPTFNLSNLVEG
jgi:hypothetical protein